MNQKEWWLGTVRMLFVACVTTTFVILGLYLAFNSQSKEERDTTRQIAALQAQARDANLAIACVLALPVDPVTGRDADDVTFCFTQYQLEPPLLHHQGG